jgi:membrane-associated protease RseP (regulator of RpoE activity)
MELFVFAAGLLVFWLFVNLLDKAVSLEKYGLKVSWVFIKYESRRFKALIGELSEKKPEFWKAFSNLSLGLGVGLMVFSIYFLSDNLLKFVKPGGVGSPVVPVLPGLTIRVYWLPYFILAFLVAAFTHEIAHGIVARLEGVRVESAGLFLALVQPGGFVEPDERELENSSTVSDRNHPRSE